MASVTVYSPDQRLNPVTSAKQQAPSGGYGEGIGEAAMRTGGAMAEFARAQDAYNARVEEAGVMELDAAFSAEARGIEQAYLQQQARNAIDARPKADEEWEALAQKYSGATSSPRQRAMMQAQLRARRDRWSSQRDNHLIRQTEVWRVGVEDSSVAALARDAATLPVGSSERTSAYLQAGARLDDIGRRRGWSQEQRQEVGFATFSNIHIATVQQLRDEQPEQALAYLEEHRDQIEADKLPTLLNQTRDDAYSFMADRDMREFVSGVPADETVEVAVEGEAPATMTVAAPVSAAVGSRFGPRRSPGGRGSTNHGGVDYPVPVNTPVVASLPGIARIKNDPDGYGRYVEIDHGNGNTTVYAHLGSTAIQDGQRVEQGQTIALSGGEAGANGAGNSTGPHLHYEFRRNGEKVDPQSVVGQSATVQPGRARPSSQGLITDDDVRERAAELAGDDWRLRAYYERAGLAEVSRRRGARADAESEAARAADEWRAAHPGAAWSTAPASIRSSVSPSYRASMAEREQNDAESEGRDELVTTRNTTFLALKDEAAANPSAFLSRDLDGYRGTLLTEGQYADLREDRRRLATAGPSGGPTVDQQISGISQVVSTYLRQSGIATEPSKMTPEEAEQVAGIRLYLSNFARDAQASSGRAPTQEELIGAMAVAVIPTRTPDGEIVPYGFAASRGGRGRVQVPGRGFMPGSVRNRITRTLRDQGIRNPTDQQIEAAYLRMVQTREIEPPSNTF